MVNTLEINGTSTDMNNLVTITAATAQRHFYLNSPNAKLIVRFIKLVGDPTATAMMHVIKKDEKDCIGVMQHTTDDYIKNITDNFYEQVNYQKPIMSISAYKMLEIKDIAHKLQISLVSELGKKKTKQILYQEILSKV